MIVDKIKRESGSVTIEATISLSAFMFAIVTILTIVNICIVQATVANAINTTAKEISQYSYLYSLTGFQKSEQELAESSEYAGQNIDSIMGDVNTVFKNIESLGNGVQGAVDNPDDGISAIIEGWNSIKEIEGAGSSLYDTMNEIAQDPKQMIFGVAKLVASESLDLAKSRLIAAPLSKVMCKKHLVNEKDGSVESYLKYLGVVPSANGSYYDGMDFSMSSLFPGGSNEIKINVSYDVKVIALLPINFKFHFNQTAVTHGWLSGEKSYQGSKEIKKEYVDNNTLWTQATVSERTEYIRHLAVEELKNEGYYLLASPNTDGVLFNPDKNEFIMPRSMNPLWSADGEEPMTVDKLDETVLKNQIEALCGTLKSNEFGDKVVVKKTENGITKQETVNSPNASYKIVLTIPEDEGLKEKLEEIISKSDTDGVTIELSPNFGKGARATESVAEEETVE